jgi:hypothetical protein
VPALKALNQIESSFFLLESDLDKSLQEGILRPKDTLESVLNSRIDYLEKQFELASRGGRSPFPVDHFLIELFKHPGRYRHLWNDLRNPDHVSSEFDYQERLVLLGRLKRLVFNRYGD